MRFFILVLLTITFTLLSKNTVEGQITLSTPDQCVQPGDTITVDIFADGFMSITGMQFSVEWDTTGLEYLSIGNYGLPLAANNFNFGFTGSGNLGTTWFGFPGVTVPATTPLFTLTFAVTGMAGTSVDILLSNFPVNPPEFSQGFPPVALPYAPAVGEALGTIVIDGPPVALCQDINLLLGESDSTATIIPAQVDGGSTDDCLLDYLTVSPDFFDSNDIGENIVVLTAYDNTGNSSTCEATVTVYPPGGPGPIAICRDTVYVLDNAGQATVPPSAIDGGSSPYDMGQPLTLAISQGSFDCSDIGDNIVTLLVTDNYGTATCTATVTIEDNSAPLLTCTNNTFEIGSTGTVSIVPEDIIVTLTENCSIASSTLSQSTFTCSDVGDNAIILTVTDPSGNTDECAVSVTIEDNSVPSIVCQNFSLQISGDGSVVVLPEQLVSTSNDNCLPLMFTASQTLFDCSDVGTVSVIVTASDASGNSISCNSQVFVSDIEVPVAICTNIIVQLDSMTNTVTVTPAEIGGSSTDNCTITGSLSQEVFTEMDLGVNDVTYTASDDSGNTDSCTATITVLAAESMGPLAICQDITVGLDENGGISIVPADVDGGTIGEVGMILTLSVDTFNCLDIGDNATLLTAEDPLGSDSCVAIVTVEDILAPVMVCTDLTVYLDSNGETSIDVDMVGSGTADNCAINSITIDQSDFNCNTTGEQLVTLEATDNSGNAASCVSTVTVLDTTAALAVCQNVSVNLGTSQSYVLTAGEVDGGSTDNCEIINYSISQEMFTCADVGLVEVELMLEDASGNISSCTSEVTVIDGVAPTAVCQDITVDLDAAGLFQVPADLPDGGSTDDCIISDRITLPAQFDCTSLGMQSLSLIVMDMSGNTDTCVSNVLVRDLISPEVVCNPVTVELDNGGSGILDPLEAGNSSTDNCVTLDYALSTSIFTCNDLGQTSSVLTVTDGSGNASSCEVSVTVVDQIAPVASCMDVSVFLDSEGQYVLTSADIDNGSADNCGISEYQVSIDTFFCSDVGTSPVTLTLIDASGNSDFCTSMVTILETELPVAICQDFVLGLDASGQGFLEPSSVDGGSTDNCGIDSMVVFPQVFSCDQIGENTVTLAVFDESGNSATCSQVIMVEDNLSPEVFCQDVTVSIGSDGTIQVPASSVDNGSTDNCGTGNSTLVPQNFTCEDIGIQTATLVVTDGSGNTGTCEVSITIEDATDPEAVCQTANIYLNQQGLAIVDPSLIDGGSADNCSIMEYIATPAQFDCGQKGEQLVQLKVIDQVGRMDSCEVLVTIVDTLAPEAQCQDIIVPLDVNGNAVINLMSAGGGSTDNCGYVNLSIVPQVLTCQDLGDNLVELIVADSSGNESSCTLTVTVEDNIAPVAQCETTTIYLDANGEFMLPSETLDGGSTDNCGVENFTLSQNLFTCGELGITEVTLTALDASGNSSSCDIEIMVKDSIAPVAVCNDITVDIGASGSVIISGEQIDGGSTDNCGVADLNPFPFFLDCGDLGQQVIELTVLDASGNSSICLANVFVQSQSDLDITCQDAVVEIDANGVGMPDPDDIFTGGGDICNSAITFTVEPASFDCSEQGFHVVELFAEDDQGNRDSCTVTVSVVDAMAPNAVCQTITVQLGPSGIAPITAEEVDGGSTDNCPSSFLASVEPAFFDCSDVGVSQAILTVEDAVGNQSTCTAFVNVQDNIFPVANCQNTTVEIGQNGTVVVNPLFIGANSTDNCPSDLILTVTPPSFGCDDVGQNPVVLTVTDQSGNSSTCNAVVTVRDIPDNVVQCVPTTVQITGGGSVSITPSDVLNELPITSCDQLTITLSKTTFNCSNVGLSNPVSVNISDPLGPLVNCVSQVTVIDLLAPNIVCLDVTFEIGQTGSLTITPQDVTSFIADNCGVANSALSMTQFDCTDIGQNAVTVFATDIHGNSSSCIASVTIEAGDNLEANCVSELIVDLDANGNASITADMIDDGSISSCGDPILTLSQSEFTCEDIGNNQVTLTVSNSTGNQVSCESTVNVRDISAPVVICQDFDLVLNETGNGFIQPDQVIDFATTEENCTNFTAVSVVPSIFNCSDIGGNPVSVTVVDDAGNSTSCIATVYVIPSAGLGLTAIVSTTPESAAGAMDGSVAVSVSGGFGDYTFQWNDPNNSSNSVVNNLSFGSYTVTVTDVQNGCQVVASGIVGIGTATVFFAGDVSGDIGQTIDVPVSVQEFNNIHSFQLSLHLIDPAVGIVDMVTNINSSITTPTVTVTGNDVTMQWTGGGSNGVSLPNGTVLFNVRVNLSNNGGSSSPVIFDNNPLPIQASRSINGNILPASVLVEDGSVTINPVLQYTVSGQIITPQNAAVGKVEVAMSGSANDLMETGANGNYAFNVVEGSSVTVTPMKDINYLNGVTTFDLVRITQHILGAVPLSSPYQIIAADATNDMQVTTFDIVTFRQLILQIFEELPNNDSWRFVRTNYVFPNPMNPWLEPFPEFTTYNNLNQNYTAQNYYGIKIGDVTGDVNPQNFTGDSGERGYSSAGVLELTIAGSEVAADEIFEVPVFASNFTNYLGFQFALEFDPAEVELVKVAPGSLPDLTEASFGLTRASEGAILASWFTGYPQTIEQDEPLFTLVFRNRGAKTNTRDLLRFNEGYLRTEAYTADMEIVDILLRSTASGDTESGFFVSQNQPNPVASSTSILYYLPEQAEVTRTVLNTAGQIIYSDSQKGEKGYAQWVINRSILGGAGVYYYVVSTPFGTEVRKMVCVD